MDTKTFEQYESSVRSYCVKQVNNVRYLHSYVKIVGKRFYVADHFSDRRARISKQFFSSFKASDFCISV